MEDILKSIHDSAAVWAFQSLKMSVTADSTQLLRGSLSLLQNTSITCFCPRQHPILPSLEDDPSVFPPQKHPELTAGTQILTQTTGPVTSRLRCVSEGRAWHSVQKLHATKDSA